MPFLVHSHNSKMFTQVLAQLSISHENAHAVEKITDNILIKKVLSQLQFIETNHPYIYHH